MRIKPFSWRATFSCFLGFISQADAQTKTTFPNPNIVRGSICHEGAGGQFGYSVSVTLDPSLTETWMAVGKPWDSSVHIYQTPNSGQNSNWASQQILADSNNGTYPEHSQSLFGYSVSLSEDGQWLAVGIPGRTYDTKTVIPLQFYDYSGAVRIYRRIKSESGIQYRLMGEIPNPNAAKGSFWDKFGSKVVLKTVKDQQGTRMFLFISANAGWDGSSANFYQGPFGTTRWPVAPLRDVTRAGVYIYQVNDINMESAPVNQNTDSGNGVVSFLQFLPQLSSVPLGSLGIDFAVQQVEIFPESSSLVLLVRDYVVPDALLSTDGFQGCSLHNCTYIAIRTKGGQNQVVNASGVVLEYMQSTKDFLFDYRTFLQEFSTEPYLDSASVNNGYGYASWAKTSWFGVGIASGFDNRNSRYTIAVGAPRSSAGVYTFYEPGPALASLSQIQSGQFLVNDDYVRRSFFGQKLAFSPDARFLIVADPAGGASQQARGQVFLYYRQSNYETLSPEVFASVIPPPLPKFKSDQQKSPYFLYPIGEFVRPLSKNYQNGSADHFGFGMAVNKQFVVLSAPVDQCLYTYQMPSAIDLTQPPDPAQPTNYTILPPPPVSGGSQSDGNLSQTWMYVGIGCGLLVLIVIPISWKLVKRHHHKSTMAKLQEMESSFEKTGFPIQGSNVFGDSLDDNLHSREPLNAI